MLQRERSGGLKAISGQSDQIMFRPQIHSFIDNVMRVEEVFLKFHKHSNEFRFQVSF